MFGILLLVPAGVLLLLLLANEALRALLAFAVLLLLGGLPGLATLPLLTGPVTV
jgi:hypothetical protein